MRQHLADILGKQAKQLVFYRCQVNFFIIVNTARNIVYPQSAIDKLRDRDVFGLHKPPLYHPEPCEKFINRERLCQVIICPLSRAVILSLSSLLALTMIIGTSLQVRICFHHLNAVNIRQSKVKYDNIRLMRSVEHDRFIALTAVINDSHSF